MTYNRITIQSLISMSLLICSSAVADTKLNLCNGIWTTKPCDKPEKSLDGVEYIAPVIKEKDAVAIPDSGETKNIDKVSSPSITKDLKEITSILHPLKMKTSEIKNKYNKNFEINLVESVCEDKSQEVAACRKAVDDALRSAREYELKLEEIQLEEKQLEESMKKPTQSGDQNVVSVNQVTTIVEKKTVVKVPNEVNPPPVVPEKKEITNTIISGEKTIN